MHSADGEGAGDAGVIMSATCLLIRQAPAMPVFASGGRRGSGPLPGGVLETRSVFGLLKASTASADLFRRLSPLAGLSAW